MLCQAGSLELREWLFEELKDVYGIDNIKHSPKWLLFIGTNPVCLVSHLDTVHDKTVSDMFIEPEKKIIHSPQGIGGDDRCGVWIILRILKDILENGEELPSIFFSTDEETGSQSTKDACDWIIKNYPECVDGIRFFIQLDRKGKNDSVYYNCDNKMFETYINSYGFETAHGSRTDICILCDKFGKAGVNLSCGFEGEHRVTEIVDVEVMLSTTQKVKTIIKEADKEIEFKYTPRIKSYGTGYQYPKYEAGIYEYD